MALDVTRANTVGNSLTELYQLFEQEGSVSDIKEKAERLKKTVTLNQENSAQVIPTVSTQDKEFLVRQELARNFDIQSGLNVYNLV